MLELEELDALYIEEFDSLPNIITVPAPRLSSSILNQWLNRIRIKSLSKTIRCITFRHSLRIERK